MKRLLLLSLIALGLTACNVTRYASPTGERFTRYAIGAKTSVQSLTVEGTTNGLRSVRLEGYQSDTAATAAACTEAAVRAVIGGATPAK